ncbi:hypothetical protein GQ53DRAFT_847029 [Thozetella sp. PMI_491]|nr:hypothetical protein GQ53DRAFT_847029 [Thozetella sp. PMI_491]
MTVPQQMPYGWQVPPNKQAVDSGSEPLLLDEDQYGFKTDTDSQASIGTRERRLACPFYKNNPRQFAKVRVCPGPGFKNISRLKEHIKSGHRDIPKISQIIQSTQQIQGTNEQKWYRIYDLLFGGQAPDSPYYEPIVHVSPTALASHSAFQPLETPAALSVEPQWSIDDTIPIADPYSISPGDDGHSIFGNVMAAQCPVNNCQKLVQVVRVDDMRRHFERWHLDLLNPSVQSSDNLNKSATKLASSTPSSQSELVPTKGIDTAPPPILQHVQERSGPDGRQFHETERRSPSLYSHGVISSDRRTLPGASPSTDSSNKELRMNVENVQLDQEHSYATDTTTLLANLISHLQLPAAFRDDEMLTDSGYASMGLVRNCQSLEDQVRAKDTGKSCHSPTRQLPRDDDEAATVYSATATITTDVAQHSIAHVCDDIYAKLWRDLDAAGYRSLAKSTPRLIKAFAIRLGMDSSHPMHLRIMHFVHKHHSEIARNLNAKFNDEGDDCERDSTRDNGEAMSVLDKMAMWDQKSLNNGSETDQLQARDLFVGVSNDDDSDPITHDDLSKYSRVILDSAAYQWLLSSLAIESSFYYGVDGPNVMADEIRGKILQRLCTGCISKNSPPRMFTVMFRVPLSPLNVSLLREHARNPLSSNTLVLTSSSGTEVQATTIRQYVEQLWPDGGLAFWGSFLELFDTQTAGQSRFATEASHSAAHFELQESQIVISVSGPAHFAAQRGEQLAWLVAALRIPDANPLTCFRPVLVNEDNLAFLVDAKREEHGSMTTMEHLLAHFKGGAAAPITNACAVWGYPTARRPQGDFSGLEIPYPALLALLNGDSPTIRAGCGSGSDRVLLEGSRATLQLVKHTNNVSLWHVLKSPYGVCPCLNSHSFKEIERFADVKRLALQRHVISSCHVARTSLSMDIDVSIVTPHSPLASCLSTPLDGSNLKNESSGSTVETDLLSVSSVSRDAIGVSPEADGILYPIIKDVAGHLLQEFRAKSEYTSQPSDGEALGSGSSETGFAPHASECTERNKSLGAAGKRLPAQRNNDDDFDEEGFQRPPVKKMKKRQDTLPKRLACPFWKLDPIKYRACFSLRLHGIPRVKQHLSRNHIPKFYCQRCLNIFADEESQNAHVLNQTPCEPHGQEAQLDGLSHQQQRQLSRKSNQTHSERQQWFAIWDIVFPGYQQPASPYMDGRLTEDCALFHKHCLDRGPQILTRAIHASGVLPIGDLYSIRDQILRRAINDALNELLDSWVPPQARTCGAATMESSIGSASASRGGASYPEAMCDTSLAGSSTDSGVFVKSQGSDSVSSPYLPRAPAGPRPLSEAPLHGANSQHPVLDSSETGSTNTSESSRINAGANTQAYIPHTQSMVQAGHTQCEDQRLVEMPNDFMDKDWYISANLEGINWALHDSEDGFGECGMPRACEGK